MIAWSIGLLGVAALGGIALFILRLREAEGVPVGLAVGHGVLAAAGVVLLAISVDRGTATGLAAGALALFVLAALGGVYLFASHLRTGSFGVGSAVIHAGVAVVAFALLVLWALG